MSLPPDQQLPDSGVPYLRAGTQLFFRAPMASANHWPWFTAGTLHTEKLECEQAQGPRRGAEDT